MRRMVPLWALLMLAALCYSADASADYEIVYPMRLDQHRNKRDLSTRVNDVLHEDEALFGFKTKKGDFNIQLKRTTGFHSDKILLRTFDENGVGQNTQHAPPSCFYHGQIANNKNSDVVVNTCGDKGIRGHVDDGEKTYYIEPIEGGQDDGAHKFYEAPERKENEAMEGISFGDDYLHTDNLEKDEPFRQPSLPVNDGAKFAELSLIPGVESQYIKYLTFTKTKYTEMLIVVDNAIYRQYGNDTKVVTQNMLNVVHSVDRSYAAINIRIVLVAVEIWTDANKMNYTTSGGAQVSAFNKYRNEKLRDVVQHDIAHYMSKRSWSGGVVGMAYMDGVCSRGHGTGINRWSFSDIRGPSGILGHELGHNFDFPHDSDMKNCTCLTTRGCFMGGAKSRRLGFTTCNLQRLALQSWPCLNNYPKGTIEKRCGNGIKEADEECDCGSPEMCIRNDPCCQPNACKLKRTSQCSDANGQKCCKNCLFKKQGTLCREAKGSCGLPEFCSGDAEMCPADLTMKDGTTCSKHASIIAGSTNTNSEKTVHLTPSIKARFLRFNPVYKKSGDRYCLRLEVLTCTSDEDTTSQVTPISTRDLYYTSSLCLKPSSNNCSESMSSDPSLIFKKQAFGDCNKPNMLFKLESDGTLRHNCSGKIVCPDSSNYLFLKKECPGNKGKYERLTNYGLRHKESGYCVEASNGWPGWPDGSQAKLRSTKDCDGSSSRTKLHFLAQDCILPIGMENGKLPNSAFNASKFYGIYKAHEARLQSGQGWCLSMKAGKNEYLQVDLGQVKTVSKFKIQGAKGSWVTGLRLFYSDDKITWKEYTTSGDPDNSFKSYCFSGKCGSSLNTQCKDLWDAEAASAGSNCWSKLNTEASGYGTCHPASNKTCASSDIYCGQLQCKSVKNKPYHINYGSQYTKVNASGEICSAGSITFPAGKGNDEIGNGIGMVSDGTKCGDKKMCYNYKCQSFSDMKIKECGSVNNKTCAGRGACDNNGKCHCDRGYDPNTYCEKARVPVDGIWGSWTAWSPCSAACNGGKRHRSRFCNTPFPAHGGVDCPGNRLADEACSTQACPKARSCKVLMSTLKAAGHPLLDGVYDIHMDNGKVMKMYCDMTSDGGGWTLVVSSHSNTWTSTEMVRGRNIDKPELLKDYSILKYADKIKDSYLISSSTFEFKLEAQNRGRWGGIWEAPSGYSIDSKISSQTDITIKKKYDNWVYQRNGLKSIMPFLIGNRLTMNDATSWGSLTGNTPGVHPAYWISGHLQEEKPEHIWYWMREGKYEIPTSCMEIKHRSLTNGKIAKSGKYQLKGKDGKRISTLCDMDSFGGGWTLLVNKISGSGWTKELMLSRNADDASKSKEYSILSHSKAIVGLLKEEDSFHYMIEADGDHHWGGIFEGSVKDGLTSCTPSANKPKLLKKFDGWNESNSNLLKTNPYVVDNLGSLLTTSLKPTADNANGILVSQTKSIYMPTVKEDPSFVRVWIREGASYKSCNHLKTVGSRLGGVYKNGFYNLRSSGGNITTVYCDMTSDPGAWTLLVTSATGNWTQLQVTSRNEEKPSITNDYSILHLADSIKNLSNNATFRYKLSAHKFNHWGGIWEAPMSYTFLCRNGRQEKVKLIKQFDKWRYNVWYATVNNRMPWLGGKKGILTTSGTSDYWWYGTIISDNTEYRPAPWISSEMKNPGLIWYWVNEDDCDADRRKVDGGFTVWTTWTKCSIFCGQGVQSRSRACVAPKPRCGGSMCKGKTLEKRMCAGKCEVSPIKSSDSLYCVLPMTGGCNVTDGTMLAWKSGIGNCELPEAQFIFDTDRGSIIHNCSGKPVCPNKGSNGYSVPIVISQTCPAMNPWRNFIRTHVGSMSFGGKCLHPSGGSQGNNVALVLWTDCFHPKVFQNFYKIAQGPVHMKYWSNLVVTKRNTLDLTSDVRFPNNPTSQGFIDNFEIPLGLYNKYGAQLSSYLIAPESGLYTFYAACDDYCKVLLSNSSSKKDAKKIIEVTAYTDWHQFNRRSEQKSAPIWLEVGKKYYIEALLVENSGDGHLSVAVTFPSGKESKPIYGYYLASNAD